MLLQAQECCKRSVLRARQACSYVGFLQQDILVLQALVACRCRTAVACITCQLLHSERGMQYPALQRQKCCQQHYLSKVMKSQCHITAVLGIARLRNSIAAVVRATCDLRHAWHVLRSSYQGQHALPLRLKKKMLQ
jgi:hypothetical protein